MRRLIVVLAVFAGLWEPAAAADGPLDTRVTIEFREAAAVKVVSALGRAAGLDVRMTPGTMKPITVALSGVKLSNALNVLCDTASCSWRLEGNVLHITPLPSDTSASLPSRVSFDVHDMTAMDVFRALATAINVPITIEPGLSSGVMSIVFKNAPTADVLNVLCAQQQCAWDFDPTRGLRISRQR